jgi:V8-like Glu-specific endopeptidase
MSDSSSVLASRARRELPDIDAVIDELTVPSRVLARVPRQPAAGPGALESMTGVAESAEPAIAEALEDGRRAVLKVRGTSESERVSLTPNEQVGLEAVILLFGRPALLVQKGTFATPPPGWEVLDAQRAAIELSIRSVGRIEMLNRGMVGTGFLVAPGVIMTNRHVAEVFSVPSDHDGWTFKLGRVPVLDYIDERGTKGSATFKVTEVIGIHPDVRIDLALLRLEDNAMGDTPHGWTAPAVLPLAAAPPAIADTDHNVYVIGYPATDNQGITPPDVMTRIFGDVFEVKRLQPGTITQISASLPRFSHDCSTLGGNSGSCVIDLETHRVIGLHFSGGYRESNYAVALWKLTADELLARAGVHFV